MGEKEYKYMVAVQCMTFNQSKYILDTLNGFVMQQTNFPYVVMVVDDASTDGEQEVIRKFVSEQFDTNDISVAYEKEIDYAHITYAQHKTNKNCYIVVLYLKENHYSQRKPKMPYLAEWRDYVKYEALCEGDDYWIDAQKLQKQVDFLEENEEYGLVYGKAKTYVQKENKFGKIIGEKKNGFEDLLVSNGIPTLTVMYRMSAVYGYDDFVKEERSRASWQMGDYPMWLYISFRYKIYFLEELSAVYRKLSESTSHKKDINSQISFINSVAEISLYFIKYSGRRELMYAWKVFYCNEILNTYVVYDSKVNFSTIKKYWTWELKIVIKLLFLQTNFTRNLLKYRLN